MAPAERSRSKTQAAAVAGHAREAELALPLGERGEFIPLGVLQPRRIVHGVVEVDVDVVRAQPTQAPFELAHQLVPADA